MSQTNQTPNPGDTLPNGAVLVDIAPRMGELILLAVIPNNGITPWATWAATAARPTHTFEGGYFRTLEAATADFQKRLVEGR